MVQRPRSVFGSSQIPEYDCDQRIEALSSSYDCFFLTDCHSMAIAPNIVIHINAKGR